MNEKARLIIDANEMIPLLIEAADKAADIKEYAISGAFMFVVNQLENAPSINPNSMRPHGKWEEIRNAYSELEGWIHKDCGREVKTKENYCPNCGAKMEV